MPFSEARAFLSQYSSQFQDIWSKLSINSTKDVSEERPFVQVAADEIPGEEVDEILGYADIPVYNAPIGLPFNFDPLPLGKEPNELLLFPLDGLEAHLRNAARDIFLSFDQQGSMDAFVDWRGEELSGRECLVAGVLECIRYCKRTKHALVIRW